MWISTCQRIRIPWNGSGTKTILNINAFFYDTENA